MPVLHHIMRSAFNTLDDQPFGDGHALTAWALDEVIQNDRVLHGICRRTLLNVGYDLSDAYYLRTILWTRIVDFAGLTSPDQRTVTVAGRGVITLNRWIAFAVETRAQRMQWASADPGDIRFVQGTGAAQNWELAGIPVLPGSEERIIVYAACTLRGDNGGDVTGVVEGIQDGGHTVLDVGGFAAVTVAYALRLEDTATGEPMSSWRQIVNVPNNDHATVVPGFGDQLGAPIPGGWGVPAWWQLGATSATWRARPVAQLELRSIAIDENEVTDLVGDG